MLGDNIHIIAHRGNLNGPDMSTENNLSQIEKCISLGYECEVDVWLVGDKFHLGHDAPQHWIDINYLKRHSNALWCHCKNVESLTELLKHSEINCFFHQFDDYTLTSHKNIWTYPGKKTPKNGIVVMPELYPNIKYNKKDIYGVCTDYVETVESFFTE